MCQFGLVFFSQNFTVRLLWFAFSFPPLQEFKLQEGRNEPVTSVSGRALSTQHGLSKHLWNERIVKTEKHMFQNLEPKYHLQYCILS